MKRYFKSAAIIFSATVMSFTSIVSASAERRAVFNDADRFLWDYINEDEERYIRTKDVSELYYRALENGKYASPYDFNTDGVTDISDAQAALNEYTMLVSVGNSSTMPESLF